VRPVLYDLFGVPISSFGVFLLLGFFVAITMARRRALNALGLDPNQTLDLSLYAIIGGIIAGRAGFILVNPREFLIEPLRMLTIWRDGGLVFYGALIGGLWIARAFAQRWRISFGALADAYAPGLIAGYGVAMIGVMLHGLLIGRPTGVPWAIEFALESRHPTQIYLLVASLGILGILRAQRDQVLAPGARFALVLFLLAIARFVVDFFVDSPGVFGPLTVGHLASAAVVVITGLLLVRLTRQIPEPVSAVEV
jgi:phosphatidylglycerol:prolipoprotein diacylglycerol transferase